MHLRLDFFLLGGVEMESIGSKLHEFRRKRGLSRRKVVEGICDESTLYRIEQDQQEPQLFTLRQLCKKLGISITDILSPDDRVKLIHKRKMKQLCRKYVYDQEYAKLDMLIKNIEKDISQDYIMDFEFSRFIHWHKAILSHELYNEINHAKQELISLLPKNGLFITETDFGAANSLGYVYLELNEKSAALGLYLSLALQYEHLPVIEDKLLYVRVMYNYIYTLYSKEDYNEVIDSGKKLIEFLKANYLNIMLAKIHHMLGITYEKLEMFLEAESHMRKSMDLFLLDEQLFNYLKSLRALAEIQFKLGEIEEGIKSTRFV